MGGSSKVNGFELKWTVYCSIVPEIGWLLRLNESTFTQMERPHFLNTVHFHLNPKFTLYIRNGHMYNSPPCLLDDIIGKDQSDFSFE